MSVTFEVEAVPTGEFRFRCYEDLDGPVFFGPFPSRDEAAAAIAEHEGSCAECAFCPPFAEVVTDVDDIPDVNVSNTNARMILSIAGLDEEELWGSMDADEFLGYIMVSLAEERDRSPVAPVTLPGQGPTVLECGLPAGYTEQRLGELADLAVQAKNKGRRVIWG